MNTAAGTHGQHCTITHFPWETVLQLHIQPVTLCCSCKACCWAAHLTTNACMSLYSQHEDSRQDSSLFSLLSLSAFFGLRISSCHTCNRCKERVALSTLFPEVLGHSNRAQNGSTSGLLFPLGDCTKLYGAIISLKMHLYTDPFIHNSIPQRSHGATLNLLLLA